MMRILYIDISLQGHRINYLDALINDNPDCLALVPERSDLIKCKQYEMKSRYNKNRDFINYIRWILEIRNLAIIEKANIVHFLCGDALYRFFGIFLDMIPTKIVVTYHHVLFGKIRNYSLKCIFKHTNTGIVHTDCLYDRLKKIGVNNVVKIEYPVFENSKCIDEFYAKKKLGLALNKPCIIIVGGTQRYKGLDILLEALRKVRTPFYLLITGPERDFSKEYILQKTSEYSDSVELRLKHLSDEEYKLAIAATDYVVLPYRFEFDGASGPMTEGVWNRKCIIGAEHGSMGSLIIKNHLGKTFKTENADDLAKVLNEALTNKLKWSKEAELYRNKLELKFFLNCYKHIYI